MVNGGCLKYGKDLRGFKAIDNKGKAREVYTNGKWRMFKIWQDLRGFKAIDNKGKAREIYTNGK